MRPEIVIVANAMLALVLPAASAAVLTQDISNPNSPNVTMTCRPLNYLLRYTALRHCGVIVWHWSEDDVPKKTIDAQFSTPGWSRKPTKKTNNPTFTQDRAAFYHPGGRNSNYEIAVPSGMSADQFDDAIKQSGDDISCRYYSPIGPNSNTVAAAIVSSAGGTPPHVRYALGESVSGCRPKV